MRRTSSTPPDTQRAACIAIAVLVLAMYVLAMFSLAGGRYAANL